MATDDDVLGRRDSQFEKQFAGEPIRDVCDGTMRHHKLAISTIEFLRGSVIPS